MQKVCSNCTTTFECLSCNNEGCWCLQYPPLLSCDLESDCMCPTCLSAVLENKTQDIIASGSIDLINNLPKSNKLIEGVDFYYTPEGYMCFTAFHHLKRGKCCGNGCRHCPY